MKRKNKFDKYFLFSWRKIAITLMIWIAAVFFHNMIYAFVVGVLKINLVDEPFFFIIAVIIIPLYIIAVTVYSLVKKFMRMSSK